MKKRKQILSLLLLILFMCRAVTSPVFSQDKTPAPKGSIAGTVLDEKGDPITGAIAVVLGLPSLGASTDIDGSYLINDVPAKTVSVQISYMSYETLVVEGVKVAAGKTTPLNVVLKEATQQLNEVVITAKYNQASAVGLYAVQKLNASMTDGLSSDLIKRTSDNNVAQVLKRVAGVTVQDNKYVTVRGMSERYNNVQLNGSSLPSTEPNRRNFSFDIIPSNLIENVTVNKTFTPDLPGEFTGGLVQIKTLSLPEEKFLSLSLGSGVNTISTGNEFQTNERFKSDYFFGETNRRTWYAGHEAEHIPQSVTNAGQMNHYGFYKYTAAALQNYALSFGLPLKVAPKHTIGLVAAATYRHEETREDIKEVNTFSRDSLRKGMSDHYNKSYKFVTAIGAVANLGWETANHAIAWRNLFNSRFTHTTLNRMMHDYYDNGILMHEIYTTPLQSHLMQTQLDGEHLFFSRRLKLTWSADHNRTSRVNPDDRFAQAYVQSPAPSPTDTYLLNWLWSMGPSNPFISTQFVMHSRLDETKDNAAANAEYSFRLLDREQKLKAGYHHSERRADYGQMYLHAFINDNATTKPVDATSLHHVYDPANFESGALYYKAGGYGDRLVDYYEGKQSIDALYLMGEIIPLKPLRIIGGVRVENAETNVLTYYHWYDNKGYHARDSLFTRTTQDWLPSLTAVYSITPSLNFRAAYSESLARADFRELSSVEYYNVNDRVNVMNMKPLEQSSSRNYDLRLEWYPALGEVVSLSAFYKDFDKPVEKVMRIMADAQTFELLTLNLDRSVIRGLELNFRKSFGFIARPLENLWLSGNFTILEGNIEAENDVWMIKKRERPLQGLSPYNLNASLMYEGERFGATVNYTRVGRTLIYGSYEDYLDQYENPRNVLDLQLYARFFNRRMEVKLNASDLLNEDIIVYRNMGYSNIGGVEVGEDYGGINYNNTGLGMDYNEGDYVMNRIGKGINLSATVSWKF
jgi:TonB-dependent receptor